MTSKGLELTKFHPDMQDPEDISLLVGKRKTGKTTGLLGLAYCKRRVPDGIAICGSSGSHRAISKVVPATYIYDEWDDKVVKELIKRSQKENYRREKAGLPKKYSFLFADDCGWDNRFCNNTTLKRVLMNGRNDGIAPVCIALQHPLDFKPALREQFDWVFLYRTINLSMRKRLFDHYAGQLGTFKLFCDVFDAVTENHGCLVIKNSGTSNRIEDNFFWWRSPLRDWEQNPQQKKWHMGSRAYWEYHFKNYDRKWREKNMNSDEDSVQKERRRRKSAVRLKK